MLFSLFFSKHTKNIYISKYNDGGLKRFGSTNNKKNYVFTLGSLLIIDIE